MSGVDLAELDLSDALDAVHYMFEEDTKVVSPEQAEAVSKARSILYRDMYNREYKYAVSSRRTASGNIDIDAPLNDAPPMPVNPASRATSAPTKPFIPATTFDPDAKSPFGTTLDSPLN